MYEIDNTDFDWFDLEANEEMKDFCGIDGLLAEALIEQNRAEQKGQRMNLVIEYEELDGIKCMTIVDTERDMAMATFSGDEVDSALVKLIDYFEQMQKGAENEPM